MRFAVTIKKWTHETCESNISCIISFLPGFLVLWLGLNAYDWRFGTRLLHLFCVNLIDAGTLSNLPAGFKARGARIRDEDNPLQPGEFRDIDVVGGTLQGSLMPLSPSRSLQGRFITFLGTLVDAGRRFASMADMKVGEMSGETPVGTTMAIMERGTKVMSAIPQSGCIILRRKLSLSLLSRIFAETFSLSIRC